MVHFLDYLLSGVSYIFKMIMKFHILYFLGTLLDDVSEVMVEGMVIIIQHQSIQVRLRVRVTMWYIYVLYTVCQEMNHLGLPLWRYCELGVIRFCLLGSSVFQKYGFGIFFFSTKSNLNRLLLRCMCTYLTCLCS